MENLLAGCRAVAEGYQGRVGQLNAAAMAALVAQIGELRSELLWLGSYTTLRLCSGDVGADEHDLEAIVQPGLAEAEELLRFFELEWIALDEAAAAGIAANPRLGGDRHFLLAMRRFAPHVLPAGEERALACREPAATEAWAALYHQTLAGVEVPVGGHHLTLDEATAALREPVEERRAAALQALHDALEPHARIVAHCYDTLVGDRLATDQLRGFLGPRAQRDLENELDPAAVDLMLSRVEGHYPIPRRWFIHKTRRLGLARPMVADEHAPLFDDLRLPYLEALQLVTDVLDDLAPELAAPVRQVAAANAIDAAPRQGKSGNAFCLAPGHRRIPYVLVNYTGHARDVLKLAHELGHAVHYQLAAQRQTPLSFDAGVVSSEVAAILVELLVWEGLRRRLDGAGGRQVLVEGLEAGFDTVFRQVVLTRFEEAAYALRAAGTALIADRLAELWLEQNARYYGDALELVDAYSLDWMRIEHFFDGRFYNYAYVFAYLASLAVLAQRRGDRRAAREFAPRMLAFLRSGGAAAPAEQLTGLGFDPAARQSWDRAFEELERMSLACEHQGGR